MGGETKKHVGSCDQPNRDLEKRGFRIKVDKFKGFQEKPSIKTTSSWSGKDGKP